MIRHYDNPRGSTIPNCTINGCYKPLTSGWCIIPSLSCHDYSPRNLHKRKFISKSAPLFRGGSGPAYGTRFTPGRSEILASGKKGIRWKPDRTFVKNRMNRMISWGTTIYHSYPCWIFQQIDYIDGITRKVTGLPGQSSCNAPAPQLFQWKIRLLVLDGFIVYIHCFYGFHQISQCKIPLESPYMGWL